MGRKKKTTTLVTSSSGLGSSTGPLSSVRVENIEVLEAFANETISAADYFFCSHPSGNRCH